MALAVWFLTVDTALLSVIVASEPPGAWAEIRDTVHLPSEYLALADFGSNRSEISTSSSGTIEVNGGNSSTSETVKDIWLIGLFPLQGSWPGGLGQLPAVQIGLEDVNADPNILPGYRLRMTMDDTEVSSSDHIIIIIIIIIILIIER